MWRDAVLVGGKDLRIEARSRVTTMQVAPFAILVLLIFGFAFDQNHSLLTQAAPGLFWVAVVLCTLLAVLEVLLGVGVVVIFGTDLHDPGLLVLSAVAATLGLAAAGTVYGMMVAGLRVRETLLPLLILPVVAPVVLGASQAWMAALGLSNTDGWKWLVLLFSFAAIYVTMGVLAFGSLVEDE